MKIPKLIAAVLLPCIGFLAATSAQAELTIDSATWDGKKLVVQGTDGRGGTVEVFYGYDTPPLLTSLGTTNVKGNGTWKFRVNSNRNNPLTPVPCAVSATLDGETFNNFPVAGADPTTCAPQPPVADVCNIAVAPTTLAFGDVTEGTTATLTTTVSNSGTVACDVNITQTGSTDFAADQLSFIVAPAGSQVVSVDYAPSAVGADAGNLAVGSNDPDTPNVDVALSGNGIPVQVNNCDIVVTPVAIIFGDVQIGTTNSLSTTVSNIGAAACNVNITQTGSTDFTAAPLVFAVAPAGSQLVTVDYAPATVGGDTGNLAVGSNDPDTPNVDVALSGNGVDNQANTPPTAVDQTFPIDTAVLERAGPDGNLGNAEIPAPGVLLNATDPDGDVLTAVLVGDATAGALVLNQDGSFEYTPGPGPNTDSFTYQADDGNGGLSAVQTVNLSVQTGLQVNTLNQNKFNILLNYELGMHCTGFEFAYCCVLPPYNSILGQVVRTDKGANDSDFPMLLEGDPNVGLDGLGRETVLREPELTNGNFNKYVMRYWHEAQPRNDGRGKPQSSTMISAVEANSMFMWNTVYDAAAVDGGNHLITGAYQGATGVVLGDGDYTDANDNYGSGWMNHFYIYSDLEGGNPSNSTAEADKIRLGLENVNAGLSLVVPPDCGPAFHPMGPDTQNGVPGDPTVANDCSGFSNGNLLTFSTDHGTVVYTQMKVLENLPVMLTSPRIWEALGLPLTPFEDTIDFFADPGLVDEDSIRPFVAMKAQLHNFDPAAAGGVGTPVFDGGNPVIGFGTAPIDIPNCERCHSELTGQNSAQVPGGRNSEVAALVQQEMDFWDGFYGIDPAVDSTWYSRLKGAAISILAIHDQQHGTSFAANYPGDPADPTNPGFGTGFPQNTRLGGESVICQKCHADNVIAVVKSTNCDPANALCSSPGALIVPMSGAIHDNHRNVSDGGVIVFADSQGRDGGCQGCHPAHRSDGEMAGYPIDEFGDNFYAGGDNRDANGGCFVGRDVHSNPGKDTDGAETPEHLNAVGQYLADNVFSDQGPNGDKGIWCTNCHTQLGQEIWRAENMVDLVHGVPGKEADLTTDAVNIRALPTLAAVGAALDPPVSEAQVIAWLDPTADNPLGDFTHEIWNPAVPDANVATLEVGAAAGDCAPLDEVFNPTFGVFVCGSFDVDGDFSVNILDFCTTPDCVTVAQSTLTDTLAAPVPFSAATDGREHWLSAGEPHCADCHEAPYTEQSGNINAFPPFNYPRKASLMRYSRGHQDISCQGCHESIHGLYPVTPTIDTTSYAQAANLNADNSHGPVNCGACHAVDGQGIPTWIGNPNDGGSLESITDYDSAIGWAHTYTDEDSVLTSTCLNCHGVQGNNWSDVDINNEAYMDHAESGNNKDLPRSMMDKAEIELYGAVFGATNGDDGACLGCHGGESGNVNCDNTWKEHLTLGRVAQSTWETVSNAETGSTCGW